MGQGLNAAFNTVKLAFANDESMSSRTASPDIANSGDWLAFVPAMRPFLQFKSLDDVSLKRETVPLSDIEFITNKIIKVSLIEMFLTVDGRCWCTPVKSNSQ
jgi:hypothetical protein